MALSIETLSHNVDFIEQVRALRALNPKADEFFRQFTEFCTDYELCYREEMSDMQQYWLMRLGRMLALLGQDPFPNITFTHPEEPHIGHGYAS